MTDFKRIYLDNAATSWPKPEAVYAAVDDYQRRLGAPAGRSSYGSATEVQRLVDAARRNVVALLNAGDPRQIVFTLNGTDSLNTALWGLLRPGDHVVATVVEHNSVLRPLRELAAARQVRTTHVRCDSEGVVSIDDLAAAVEPATRLIALTHASNVTGALQPVEAAAHLARQRGCRLLIDAAQTLGHVPLDVQQVPADLIAAPGHKGLLGPLGTGVLYVREGVEREMASCRQGGTGSRSEDERQPEEMPDKFEAGNLNLPGIVGLGAGTAWILEQGVDVLESRIQRQTARLLAGLQAVEGVTIYGPADPRKRVGVVAFNLPGCEPQEAAAMLDASFGLQVRAGLHCAPRMHQALGTFDGGGAVRFGLGPFHDDADIEGAIEAVAQLAAALQL